MLRSVAHINIPTLYALIVVAAAVLSSGAAAPDRDAAARAASVLALGVVWSDICGQEDPTHRDCPFCTLPQTGQKGGAG